MDKVFMESIPNKTFCEFCGRPISRFSYIIYLTVGIPPHCGKCTEMETTNNEKE